MAARRYFWGHEDGPGYIGQRWHCFPLSPDQPGPDHESEYAHVSLCGVTWCGLGAVPFPETSEKLCMYCVNLLQERATGGAGGS